LCFCISIYNVHDISYENILIYSLLKVLVCCVWYMRVILHGVADVCIQENH